MGETKTGLLSVGRGLLKGNVRVLAFTSMMTGTYLSFLNTILQPFVVTELGFSLAILGALVAVGSRPLGIASSIAQPFGGELADRLGRKLLILLGSSVGICSMLSFLLAATTHSLVPLALGYVLLGLSLLGSPATQAMIAETVEMDPQKLNVAFSVVFFFTALPGAFIPFAAGYLAQSAGYAVLFAGAAVIEGTNIITMLAYLRETRDPGVLTGTATRKKFSFRQVVTLPPGPARIFIPFAMDAAFYGVGGAIIFGAWSAQLGFTPGDIGLIFGVLSVSVVGSQYFATKLLLKIGTRRTLAFSEGLTVVVMAGWYLSTSLPVLLAFSVVFGFSVATWVPAVSSLLMRAAPVEERGSIGGKLAAFRGLLAAPAPIIGGVLSGAYGYQLPVAIGLVGEALTVVAILKLIPSDP